MPAIAATRPRGRPIAVKAAPTSNANLALIHMPPAAAPPIDVFFLLLPDSLILDWAGPAEALRSANRVLLAQGQAPHFRLHFVGPAGQTVSSVGATVAGLQPLPDQLPQPSWLVLVGQPGETLDFDNDENRAALHWLRGQRLASGRRELMCVCAGAVLAAHAGLLTHRKATTHHHHLDELARADAQCDVLANRVFVADPPVWSSAGVTCGIDLTLQRIADVCGPALAARVAQNLALALRRGPQDAELSPFLRHRDHLSAALHRLQDAVGQAPQIDWTLERMAQTALCSPRHLTRLFAQHIGVTPQQYLRDIRLALARAALQAGHGVTQAAGLAGFHSDSHLRRAWRDAGWRDSPGRLRAASAPDAGRA